LAQPFESQEVESPLNESGQAGQHHQQQQHPASGLLQQTAASQVRGPRCWVTDLLLQTDGLTATVYFVPAGKCAGSHV
jgi:hypothetical protein